MNLDLFNLKKVVINLPERIERLVSFKTEYQKIFNDDVIVLPGIKHTTPYKGIAMAHKSAIQYAKSNNLENILIMEDDLVFHKDYKLTLDYITECFKDVPQDFDILLGGLYTSAGLTSYNSNWNRTGEFSALHFYIVNSKCYDIILSFDESEHIDRWLAKQRGGNLKCYVSKKFFCIQKVGYSDNKKDYIDYSNLLGRFKLL